MANYNFLPLNSLLATLSCLCLAYIYNVPNMNWWRQRQHQTSGTLNSQPNVISPQFCRQSIPSYSVPFYIVVRPITTAIQVNICKNINRYHSRKIAFRHKHTHAHIAIVHLDWVNGKQRKVRTYWNINGAVLCRCNVIFS